MTSSSDHVTLHTARHVSVIGCSSYSGECSEYVVSGDKRVTNFVTTCVVLSSVNS